MLNTTLQRRICEVAARWQALVTENLRLADAAKEAGDWRKHYAHSYIAGLPDLYWVLEDYNTARLYYRLSAQRQMEKRAWYEANDPSFPINVDLIREAKRYLRAGLLDQGRHFLRRAYDQETAQREPSAFHLREIALAAAQLGQLDLVGVIHDAVEIRVAMLSRCRERTRRAARLLRQIGPAEVAFILGDYQECERRLEAVFEAQRLIQPHRLNVYCFDGQTGVTLMFAKAQGLAQALQLQDPRRRHRETYEHALQYFERAMDRALRIENLPGEGYQLRLYARLACDLLEGRQPDPNPFATLDHEQQATTT